MKTTTKFTKSEKQLIALVYNDNYVAYKCTDHSLFFQRKDVANAECTYCKKVCKEIQNISELKEEFKKELKL